MIRQRCVHLNDDFSMGGVVKALGVFDHPDLASHVASKVKAVVPRGVAPRLDADVIITHFPPSWAALPFLVSLRARNPRARLVHIEHSYTRNWEAWCVSARSRFRLMLRLAYRLFDEVVSVSEGQAGWLREHRLVDPDKLHVINPWSGSDALASLPDPGFSSSRPLRLGAIGRFAESKGFDLLIEAMWLLPKERFELFLAGSGPEEDALHQRALGLPNVTFVGMVNVVADFYAQCDVVVVPSRWESFGLVVAEARQAGRPVLVADTDGLPEQVGSTGLVADCSNPACIAVAIEALADGPLAVMSALARRSMADAELDRVTRWTDLFRRARKARSASAGGRPRRQTPLADHCRQV